MDWKSKVAISAGTVLFLYTTRSIPSLMITQRPSQWSSVIFSPRIKRSERETGHLPLYNAEVKNGGAIPLHTKSLNGTELTLLN
jgi:hypothetical protein